MTAVTTEAGPFTCGGCGKPVTRETRENGWRDEDGDPYCYEGGQHAPETAADRFPLTCGWCRNSPATHLLITDVKAAGKQSAVRHEEKVCAPCAHRTTVLPSCFVGFWLYELVPDHCDEKEASHA